nr:hypothetical protein [Vitiosangium cumulatum]
MKLRELLLDVATSRREFEDDPQQFLEILVGAAALYPVFDGWPSPVDEWLEEAERLGREVDAGAAPELWQETMGLLAVRRAIVAMRRRNQEGALRALEAARQPGMPPRVRLWEATTRARVHVRQHAFDEAERALAEAGSYVHEAGDNPEAYRTLATGLSIARRLGLASAEALFRIQVNRMRDVVLGPERFDRMVEDLLRQSKQ